MPLSYRQLGNLFTAGPNITIYPSGNSYAISATSSGGGSGIIISGRNVGTGTGVFCGLTTTVSSNDTLAFYNLSGGNEVGISINDDGEIVVVRGRTVVNTVSNQGGGAKVYTGITGTTLFSRTISGANGFTSALFNSAGIGTTSAITANTLVRLAPTNTSINLMYTTASGRLTIFGGGASGNINTTIGTLNLAASSQVTNTRLAFLAPSTTGLTTIKFAPSPTEPISPSDGSIWYTNSNELKMQRGGTTTEFLFSYNNNSFTGESGSPSKIIFVDSGGTLSINDSSINKPRYINSFGIFNALSSLTISNTTTQTSIISSVLTGTTTLLASNNSYNPELAIGRKYRFNARGTISIQNVDTTLIVRIKLGSTIISSSSTISFFGSINPYDGDIEIDSTFTVRNSGLIFGSGKIVFPTAPPSTIGGDPVIFGIYSQNQTITTTTNQVFDCTVQFDVADSGSSIIINESTLEILN